MLAKPQFTPNENFNGETSFELRLTDEIGDTFDYEINIVVTPVDDLPLVVTVLETVAYESNVKGKLATTDIDGDVLEYSIFEGPLHGSVTISNTGEYSYSANSGFTGKDSFIYQVSDGVNIVKGKIELTILAKQEAKKAESSSGGSISILLLCLLLFNMRRIIKINN